MLEKYQPLEKYSGILGKLRGKEVECVQRSGVSSCPCLSQLNHPCTCYQPSSFVQGETPSCQQVDEVALLSPQLRKVDCLKVLEYKSYILAHQVLAAAAAYPQGECG